MIIGEVSDKLRDEAPDCRGADGQGGLLGRHDSIPGVDRVVDTGRFKTIAPR